MVSYGILFPRYITYLLAIYSVWYSYAGYIYNYNLLLMQAQYDKFFSA